MRERRSRIVPAFAKLMGVEESQVDERDLPVIALAGSGGGYRAMVSCMGAVGAAEEMGLWDTVSFVSGVSGSCWALSTLYSVGEGEIEKTLRHVKGAVGTPFLDPSSLERLVKGPTHEYLMEGAVLKSASETGELSL